MNTDLDQFEAGENITDQVIRRKAAGIVVSVRLSPEDSHKLVALAEESGRTVSQLARQALTAFISRSKQSVAPAPEITGNTQNVEIIAFAPLGPRSRAEHVRIVEHKESGKVAYSEPLALAR